MSELVPCPVCGCHVQSEHWNQQVLLTKEHPIRLNLEQQELVDQWAKDDRLWTTEDTVNFNLRTFARAILKAQPVATDATGKVLLTKQEWEEAQRDTKRLDWLESCSWIQQPFGNQVQILSHTIIAKTPFQNKPTVREAIDAASAGSKGTAK